MKKIILTIALLATIATAQQGWTTLTLINWSSISIYKMKCNYSSIRSNNMVSITTTDLFCPMTIKYNYYLNQWK